MLITGAGSGIGRLMAYKFAELGAIVVCTDINKQTADETCNAIIGNNFVESRKRKQGYSLGYSQILHNLECMANYI